MNRTKLIRGKFSLLLAFIFIVSIFPLSPASPVYAADNPTSFYSGFESTGDPVPLVSVNVAADGILGQTLASYRGVTGVTTGNLDTGMITNTHSPSIRWNSVSNNGYSGKSTLGVAGRHTRDGAVSAMNKVYEFGRGNEIRVTPTTELSYMIAPTYNEVLGNVAAGNLEYGRYPSQHVCIDLHFTNGKYLSELNCYDSHGVRMDPQSQFEGKCMWEGMWNKVLARIGEVANGLLIDQVLVSYANKDGASGYTFEANIDDLRIVERRSDDPSAQPFDAAFNSAGEIIHPSELTDTRRGSNSSGGTFSRGNQGCDINTPFSFNFWGPQTSVSASDPYMWQTQNNTTANLPVLRSFAANHRPSRWIGDRGNFQFLPNVEATLTSATMATGARGYQFSHNNEIAKCYYYSVVTNNGMKSEISPTMHGLHARITYPAGSATPNITFDALGSTVANGFSIAGLANNEMNFIVNHNSNSSQNMYVYAVFNVVPTERAAISGMRSASSYARFPANTKVVEMRIATSYISWEQAKANCNLEVKATFDETKAAAQKEWDDRMKGVLVKDFAPAKWNGAVDTLPLKTLDGLVTFYSNLYKLYSWPNAQHENTGAAADPVWQYRTPYGGSIKDGQLYINNGFWDTYKSTWNTYGLLLPDWTGWMLNGLVNHYMDSGFVPRWSAPAGTNSMVGTSSDIVFGTAAMRGLRFDIQRAMESAVKSATVNNTGTLTNGGRSGLTTSIFNGFATGSGTGTDALSWSLEGYINDFGISQMARMLGYTDMAAYYTGRATNYVLNWNPFEKTDYFNSDIAIPGGWLRQRNTNNTTTGEAAWGQTDAVFNPYAWLSGYTETNAWDMAVTVVDGQGMANLLGGAAGLEKRLDGIFTSNQSWVRGGYSDIHEQREHSSVKMGQYGHSNQPSHQIPFFYNFTDSPWKTQMYVREILDRLYTNWETGFGYCGDEDNGEMSGVYVVEALGFSPTSLGWDEFYLTAPYFEHITVTQDNGTVIDIKAPGVSMTNKYIQGMKLNGVSYNKTYISSADLYGKAVNSLEYVMGPTPSNWGTAGDSKPNSLTAPGVTPQPLTDLTKFYSNRGSEGDAVITGGGDVANPNNLFDNSMATNATSSGFTSDVWFGYQFGAPQVVHLYTVTCSSAIPGRPRSWVFEASNDGANWDVLDTRTNVTFGFDTRSLGPVGTAVTKEQALTQGTVWTACGSGFAQNNTQSTMPFGVINDKAYTQYRVRVTSINSGTTVEIAELEFMGYKNPSNAYIVAPDLVESGSTYTISKKAAAEFSLNLARRPVADVNVKVTPGDLTLTFGPDDFAVAKQVNLFKYLTAPTQDLTVTVTSDDPTYNAKLVYPLSVNAGDATELVFSANIDSYILLPGKRFTATAKATNVGLAAPKTVNAILGLYDGNGRLVDIGFDTMTLEYGDQLTCNKVFDIPSNAQGYTVKAFFWDNNYVPYRESIDFN